VRGEFHVVRQFNRQVFFRHGHDAAVVAVDYRYRGSPVALPRHQPVPEPVIDPGFAPALAAELPDYLLPGLGRTHTGEFSAVDQDAVPDERQRVVDAFLAFYYSLYGKVILRCEFIVSLIVG